MASDFSGFLKKYWLDLILTLLILCLSPLFLYKLGQPSLVSWDEAWYAAIARNILKTGDFLRLTWNGAPYFDHPAAGFWWMAIGFKIWGVSNFSARLPSAVFGILTLIFTYLLGKGLFNRWVGFSSSIALVSAPWFLYRARSGNLDVFLTFFFVVSIWLAVKSVSQKKTFLVLGVSLALLFLTKTLIPLAIVPPLIIIYLGRKIEWKWPLKGLVGFLLMVGAWFFAQITWDINFIGRYFYIGLPGVKAETAYLSNLKLVRDYVHEGIGRWFWPSVASVVANLLLGKRSFYILSAFCLTFTIPFIFSGKTQIWHLIPLYPFLLLSLFGLGFFVIEKVARKPGVTGIAILLIALYFSFNQTQRNWHQFIDISAYVSDEEILSAEASKYLDPLVVDGDFVPAAVFYSGKDNVVQAYVGGLTELFKNNLNFLLITQKERLDTEKISPKEYRILKSDRDKILVRKI
jgi:4-amino-4-deoxy-L-arabinose transferase-like glycosyltransferase